MSKGQGDPNAAQLVLATGGYDHTIKLWQAHTGTCLRTLQHADTQVNALDISPDKSIIAAAGHQHIRLYDMISTAPIVNFVNVSKNVTDIGFFDNCKWMYTGGEDFRVRIWDLHAANPVCKKVFDCLAPVNAVCLHPNQVELAVGTQGGSVYLWNVQNDAHEHLIPDADQSFLDVAISPDGQYLAATTNRGLCYIWTLATAENQRLSIVSPKKKIEVHKRYALTCKFSPNSLLLVTTSDDATARVFKVNEDFLLWRILKKENSTNWIWDACFSADSQYLFTASSDGVARLWKLDTTEIEREYIGHSKAITSMAFKDEIIR